MLDTTSKRERTAIRRKLGRLRNARHRKRLRQGRCCVTVEITEHHINLAVRLGYLTERDASDRAKLTAALNRMLADAE